nr:helicase-related protein [uncultured Macellibacteroides sp.]
MFLTEDTANKLINLNPNPELDIIDPGVAERQFQVILKGFNFLMQPENKFLYIADEVGLGKTYIAIGIASLLRHFSVNPDHYTDVILVPKQNLQFKWLKEINIFIQKNYLLPDGIVKSVLNKPAAYLSRESIKHDLSDFDSSYPSYVLYRNSSFSLGSDSDLESNNWTDKLKEKLKLEQRSLFDKVCKKFRYKPIIIKHAYAYLLNQSLPEIDLLIVDEAHNYKHGIDGDISIRNQLVSRVFGACTNDVELFNEFPELKEFVKPKVKKLLFLSATPINTQLYEIKRQLDCFLVDHSFKNLGDEKQTESYINSKLNDFMIRGLMTIKVNNQSYSRNSYRHEHRYGNVVMEEKAAPQCIKDNKTALVLSLMQYKTIKELNQKNNNQFEMGMLAGFESFESNVSEYEEESLASRNDKEAKDEHVISGIVESYYKEFSCYPPHPKQDSLVEEVFNLMLKREKSLIFVRRIASVRELERKLLKKYSDHILDSVRKIRNYVKYPALKKLIEISELEKNRDDIDRITDLLTKRLAKELKQEFNSYFDEDLTPPQQIGNDLRDLFYSSVDNIEIERFQEEFKQHLHRNSFKSVFIELIKNLLLKKWRKELIINDEDDDEVEEDNEEETSVSKIEITEEKSHYFFQRFFYNEGKSFKKRMYRKNWFELNLILINERYNIFELDEQQLSSNSEFINEKNEFKKFDLMNNIIIKAIRSDNKNKTPIHEEFRTNTLLTNILLDLLEESFTKWIGTHRPPENAKSYSRFIDELNILNEILRSIFRQGSGLIPTFIAEALSKGNQASEGINSEMEKLLLGDFSFVLNEIDDVLNDYDKIKDKNFDDKNKIRYNLIQQLPVLGVSGQHKRDVRKTAIQFRMPGYPYVLIATDILKEGEDLHSYCKNIYHYGIAWNPSDMEQRTGRVDRIDSLAYRNIKQTENTKDSDLAFASKLQVFYPYLADTLEVNQMCRLFNGMNRFIDIFYNDLSIRIEKDSKAQVDELVENIIPQRTGLLKSKYDIRDFNFIPTKGYELKHNNYTIGQLAVLKDNIRHINDKLLQENYYIKPDLDIDLLKIVGVMNVRNNRQGPFEIYIDQKKQLNMFEYKMQSCLGRVNIFGSHANKQKLMEFINNIELEIIVVEKNSFIWLQLKMDIDEPIEDMYNDLIKLINFTDQIEESISKIDESFE